MLTPFSLVLKCVYSRPFETLTTDPRKWSLIKHIFSIKNTFPISLYFDQQIKEKGVVVNYVNFANDHNFCFANILLIFFFLDWCSGAFWISNCNRAGFYGHPYEAIRIPDIDVSLFWTWEGTRHILSHLFISHIRDALIFCSLISSQVFCCWWTASTPAVTRKRSRSGFSSTKQ